MLLVVSALFVVVVVAVPVRLAQSRERAYEIFRAIGDRNAPLAVELIHQYKCVSHDDSQGWSMMHAAAYWKLPTVVEALLEEGANINVLHDEGKFRPLDCVIGDPQNLNKGVIWDFRRNWERNRQFIQFMREHGAEGEKLDRALQSMNG